MAPILALILVILLIVFLLYSDSKHVEYELSDWIPLIWFLISGSRMVSLWFNLGSFDQITSDNYLEGSPTDRYIFIILIFSGIIVLYRRNLDIGLLFERNKWIIVFFIYCMLSVLWSDYPYVSTKRYIKNIGNIVMVLILLSSKNNVLSLSNIFKKSAYILIPISIVLIKYFPQFGRHYHRYSGELTLTGVTTNKNSLGVLCLVVGFYLFWAIFMLNKRNKIFNDNKVSNISSTNLVIIFIATMWLLFKSNSMSSLLCFIVGVIMYLFLSTSFIKEKINSIGVILVIIFCAVFMMDVIFDVKKFVFLNIGRDTTLTSRTDLWIDMMRKVENPLIGFGYDSFWLGERMTYFWETYWWHPTEAHNGYLETYVELGFIGLFLLLLALYNGFKNIKNVFKYDYDIGKFKMAMFIIIIFYNITESAFKGLHLIWFIFLLISISYKDNINYDDKIIKHEI